MRTSTLRLALLLVALPASAALASADVAYTSFGTLGSGYNPFSGRTIAASPLEYSAQQFTSGITGSLTSILIPGSGSGSLTIELLADNAGAPGALLASATSGAFSLYSLVETPISGATLNAGGKYWVGLRPVGSANVTWNAKSDFANLSGPVAANYRDGGSVDPNGFLSAMRVNATPVPEPATMAVLGLGLLALRRRK